MSNFLSWSIASALQNSWDVSYGVGDDFYVRPPGAHGNTEDGLTYDTAWLGLDNVVYGGSGVGASDSLWICGTHIHTVSSNSGITSQGLFMPTVTGVVNGYINIRGDYPGDPGHVWGAWKDTRTGGGGDSDNWADLGGGKFQLTTTAGTKVWARKGLFKNLTGGSAHYQYTEVADADSVTSAGEYFLDENIGSNVSQLTIIDPDATDFTDFVNNHMPNIRFSDVAGWRVVFNEGTQYIRLAHITFWASEIGHAVETATAGPYGHYILDTCRWTPFRCRYWWAPWNTSNVEIKNLRLDKTGNGLYGIGGTTSPRGTLHNYHIHGGLYTNIGQTWGDGVNPAGIDGHAVGVQENRDWTIDGIVCVNCGAAIDHYVYAEGLGQYNIVTKNCHIYGSKRSLSSNPRGYGILYEGDADIARGMTSGNLIENNVVVDCEDIGIGTTRKDLTTITGNRSIANNRNYHFNASTADGNIVIFNGNHSADPRSDINLGNTSKEKKHIYFNQNSGGAIDYTFTADDRNTYTDDKSDVDAFFFNDSAASISEECDYTDYLANHVTAGNDVDS